MQIVIPMSGLASDSVVPDLSRVLLAIENRVVLVGVMSRSALILSMELRL